VVLLSILPGVILTGQAEDPRQRIIQLIKAFRAADTSGERLTDDGWRRAAKFFVNTPAPPKIRVFEVIAGGNLGNVEPWIQGPKKVEVRVEWLKLGGVDELARFQRFEISEVRDQGAEHLRNRPD
jgi:hypothetical protein